MAIKTLAAAAALATLSLGGCVMTTDPVPVGRDSFMISTSTGGSGLVMGQGPIANARAANRYCDQHGLHMIIRRTDGMANINGTSNALIFSCVTADDPEYQRPNLRHDPNVTIEDSRR
jgi:hypothetical protein